MQCRLCKANINEQRDVTMVLSFEFKELTNHTFADEDLGSCLKVCKKPMELTLFLSRMNFCSIDSKMFKTTSLNMLINLCLALYV